MRCFLTTTSATLPHLLDHIGMGVFDVFQIPYSAAEREHEDLIGAAAEAGAGIVVRGGTAKGAPSEGKQSGLQWQRWRQAQRQPDQNGRGPQGQDPGDKPDRGRD